MYCRKCGYALPSDGLFCPKCGCEVEKNINSPKSKKDRLKHGSKKTLKIVIACLCCLLIIGGTILGVSIYRNEKFIKLSDKGYEHFSANEMEKAIELWEQALEFKSDISKVNLSGGWIDPDNLAKNINNEIKYCQSILSADEAINNQNWEEAVDNLNTAIEIHPIVAKNYLSLATAYVEQWDLYNADRVLKEGFEVTCSQSLKNVSIWGPLSLVETAYYMTDYMPITRCEYLFSDNGINSYVYAYGDPVAGASYICENGKVRYITLLDYDEYSFIGLYPQQVNGLPIYDSVLTYFDVEYNDRGQLAAVSFEGTTFVTLDYDNEKSATLTATANFRDVFSAGDSIKFNFNDRHLISEVIYGDIGVEFEYNEDGSYKATIPSINTILDFDSAGLFVGLTEPNGADNFSANSENGRLLSYEMEGLEASIGYDENRIITFEISRTLDVTVHNSIRYFYEEINGLDYLVEMEYTLPDGGTAAFQIYYDENGKIERIYDELNSYDMTLSYTNNRLTSYTFIGRDLTTTVYLLNYDNVGRYIGKIAA